MKRLPLVSLAAAAAVLAGATFAADKVPAAPAAAPAANAPAAHAPAAPDMGRMHAGFGKDADVGDVKVPKATGPNARTVAEIVTKRTELKDKPVLVRGKVVKFTGGVMGKNWLHVRDGTGSASDKSNDLVVTTADETSVGAVVLVKGTVRTDVQLGSGYAYAVMVDGASLQK